MLLLPEVLSPMDRLGRGDSNGGVAGWKQCHRKKLSDCRKSLSAAEVILWQQKILKMKVGWSECYATTRCVVGVGTVAKP